MKTPFHIHRQNDRKLKQNADWKEKDKRKSKPSRTWSSGPREESPQISQTTLPWISPVQALAPKTNNKRIKPITVFSFSMVEIEKNNIKIVPFSEHFMGSFLNALKWCSMLTTVHWFFHRHNSRITESNARVNEVGTKVSLCKTLRD